MKRNRLLQNFTAEGFGMESLHGDQIDRAAIFAVAMEAFDELQKDIEESKTLATLAVGVENIRDFISQNKDQSQVDFARAMLSNQFDHVGLESEDFGIGNDIDIDELNVALENFLGRLAHGVSKTYKKMTVNIKDFVKSDLAVAGDLHREASNLLARLNDSGYTGGHSITLPEAGVIAPSATLTGEDLVEAFKNMHHLQGKMKTEFFEETEKYLENVSTYAAEINDLYQKYGPTWLQVITEGVVISVVYQTILNAVAFLFMTKSIIGAIVVTVMTFPTLLPSLVMLGVVIGVPFGLFLKASGSDKVVRDQELNAVLKKSEENLQNFKKVILSFGKSPLPGRAYLQESDFAVEYVPPDGGKPMEGLAPNKKQLKELLETVMAITEEYRSTKDGSSTLSRLDDLAKKDIKRKKKNVGWMMPAWMEESTLFSSQERARTGTLHIAVNKHILHACERAIEYARLSLR